MCVSPVPMSAEELLSVLDIDALLDLADLASAQIIYGFRVVFLLDNLHACRAVAGSCTAKIFGLNRLAEDIDTNVIVTLPGYTPFVVDGAAREYLRALKNILVGIEGMQHLWFPRILPLELETP